MPFSTYLPEHMGSIRLTPSGPFVAGAYAELTLTYTAGTFGIDDTGMVKISWRTTSDMSKPQFDKPAAANFTTVEASNGAKLDVWFDRLNIRPYANTLLIRVGRGYLRAGDRLTVRMGDRRQGSPGYRLQTNCEARVELKTSIDAFATYEFTELPEQPAFALVPGPAAHWKAIWPSLAVVGEPFRLAIVAEDAWGNPTSEAEQTLALVPSHPIRGLPQTVAIKRGDGPRVLDNLIADAACDIDLRLMAQGEELARANPLRVVAAAPLRRYWGDLHGQSGETIGMGSAESYFRYARDLAFIDMVGHQGNDFQITDAFWAELNRLTAAFDAPGRFVCLPGYEWSGNTGMGGDRNVFFRREGRPIRRSSHILVEGQTSSRAVYTADELFRALDGEDAVVIAHVGGRYADIKSAHDGRIERSVEVHSTWGTFEWLLHDAFDKGYRVGVVCHSDDHKGRPGATRRDASMGDIIRPGSAPMRLAAEVIGTAPIEHLDVLYGAEVVQTARPFAGSDLGRRVRVTWQGAEYRGRGRETMWQGKLTLTGNRIARFAPVNFLNPERKVVEASPGAALAWSSVTTGNLAGIDIWLDEARRGTLALETNVVSGEVDLAKLDDGTVAFDGGGLARRISVYRLPEQDWSRRLGIEHVATFAGGADLPVYVRVTQSDGHQAWSSPIYLIA